MFSAHPVALTRALAPVLGIFLFIVTFSLPLPVASAHDLVVDSSPVKGENIDSAPSSVVLTFSGQPKEGFNRIAVSHEGKVLFSGEPQAEGRVLTLPVPEDVEWEPGRYTVGFQITSSDGHATRGSLDFSFQDASAQHDESASGSKSVAEEGSSNGGVPSWLYGLVGIVVIAGALVIAIARWRALSQRDD